MKEKQTYRQFDLPSFLAILGCAGMLVFECIFIFELYDRAPSQVANFLPAQAARREPVEPVPAAIQTNAPAVSSSNPPVLEKAVPVPAATNAAPVSPEPVRPVPSAEPEKIPAAIIPAG